VLTGTKGALFIGLLSWFCLMETPPLPKNQIGAGGSGPLERGDSTPLSLVVA